MLHSAFVGLVKTLCRQPLARRAKALVVHGVLERVVLPAKDVVAVLSVASSVCLGSCFSSCRIGQGGVGGWVAVERE